LNSRILEILRNSVANAWKKKGCSCYRSLLIDDSKESEEAIRFMEDLGFAYRLEYLDPTRETNGFRLPALLLSHSRIFQGLEEIKTYGGNLPVSPPREAESSSLSESG